MPVRTGGPAAPEYSLTHQSHYNAQRGKNSFSKQSYPGTVCEGFPPFLHKKVIGKLIDEIEVCQPLCLILGKLPQGNALQFNFNL